MFYALFSIFVALAVTKIFTALELTEQVNQTSETRNFLYGTDSILIFVSFIVVVFWLVLWLGSEILRSWKLRRQLRRDSSHGEAGGLLKK